MENPNAFEKMRYLRLTGVLREDNQLRLRPAYLLDEAPQIEEADGPDLTVAFFNAQGDLLLRRSLPVSAFCADEAAPQSMSLNAVIPYPPQTREVRVHREEVLLATLLVAESRPEVRWTWDPAQIVSATFDGGSSSSSAEIPGVSGRQMVTWEANHAEGLPLHSFVSYSYNGGQSWQRLTPRLNGFAAEIDFDQLPGGDACLLKATVSDGVNTEEAVSAEFPVGQKPCQAYILSPSDGALLEPGFSILLRGQGYYLEEGEVELQQLSWHSSLDGPLGSGQIVDLAQLSPGDHTLTLVAGPPGRQGQASIHVIVGA